ncbi:MAG TPA: LysM peptidoglycan-binding domain-containing protein [Opitutaceae bacterium]|jgi:nucleoid-associated protein YgaU
MNRLLRIGLPPIALVLAATLRADDQAAPAHPDDVASLRADNKQLSDELASAWKEADRLKGDLAAAQSTASKNADEAADLRRQLDAAKAQAAKPDVAAAVPAAAAPAEAPAPDSDAAKQVADLQDKLALALRSFSVLQDEDSQLKTSAEKAAADNSSLSQQLEAARASITSLQAQAAATSQIEPLRAELRQAEDESNRLALENEQYRSRLAVQSNSPTSTRPVPTRPGQAASLSAAPAAAPAASAAAPAAPRTYVVAEGDTLTKIARKFYGNSSRWEQILKANRGVVKDEKSLVVGSSLTIP